MRKFLRLVAPLVVCSLFIPLKTYAWNALGHMVVADIAYQQLTPTAKKEADKLVAALREDYPQIKTFSEIAPWPDTLHGQHIETYSHWHYIDKTLSADGGNYGENIDTDNAVWALSKIKPVVKYKNANIHERARFLSFFVHIVGDLHQPLHTVSYYSDKHPEGDRGGNSYHIRYKKKRTKLHHLWDQGVGVFSGYYSPERAHDIAQYIMSEYPMGVDLEYRVDDRNPDHWVAEGMENAKKYVYSISEEEAATTAYLKKAHTFIEKDAALAGYRLALLLNDLLDPK